MAKKSLFKKSFLISILIMFCVSIFVPVFSKTVSAESGNFSALDFNAYLSNYDYEKVVRTLSPSEYSKPDTYGKFNAEEYPTYYNKINFDLKDANTEELLKETKLGQILAENLEILSSIESDIANNNLRKHLSADGQFFGTVPDNAPRIVKEMTINYMVSSRHSLGVFAPAGEVLTVHIDKSIVDACTNPKDPLSIIVGYPFLENNARDFNSDVFSRINGTGRMPYIFKEFIIKEEDTKIGSPFGGIVFLSNIPSEIKENFTITVSGGVDMPSYKYGLSTNEDWQNMLNSPSPMVWIQTPYVYFMGPKVAIENVENPDLALAFWYKAAMLSNYAMSLDTLKEKVRPVIMMFDAYVPGGSALAYPGLFAAICPTDWLTGSLNYESLLTSTGSWGIIHEMNHNFQYPLKAGYHGGIQWSVGKEYGDYMEITNNVNNIMAYILYTDIASSRTDRIAPSGGGWGVTVDPYYNLKTLLNASKVVQTEGFANLGGNRVYAYADLIHSFGVDSFLHFLRVISGGELSDAISEDLTLKTGNGFTRTEDGFALTASKFFKRDMVDYFAKTLHFKLSEEVKTQIHELNYPKHVSLQNVYALGEINAETGKPFTIDYSEKEITLDLFNTTLSSGARFEIVSVSEMKNGSVLDNQNGTYTFKFDDNAEEISFNINYNVWLEGEETPISKTLVAKIHRNVNFSVEATEYNVDSNYSNGDIRNYIAQFVNENNIKEQYKLENLTTVVTDGLSLTRLRANVVFDFTGDVTFMVYGDDKTLLRVDGKEAVCNGCMGESEDFWYWRWGTFLTMKEIMLTVHVEAGEPVLVEAYCLNLNKGGNIKVFYSSDGVNYSNFLSNQCLSAKVSEEVLDKYIEEKDNFHVYDVQYDLTENALSRFYSNSLGRTKDLKGYKVVDENNVEIPPNGYDQKVTHLTDGNMQTWYTAKTTFNYPFYYIFEFNERVSLNSINLYFYDDTYAGTAYDYYVSEDGDIKNLGEPFFVRDNSAKKTTFEDKFKTVTGKFIILKIYGGSKNGTSIREIVFNQSLEENTNLYSSQENVFTFNGEENAWINTEGVFINGKAKYASEGEFSFVLSGTDILLYSINDASKMLIDGEEYVIHASTSTQSPSLFVQGLTNGRHSVRIIAKNMTFDAIRTSGEIFQREYVANSNIVAENLQYSGTELSPVLKINDKTLKENVDYEILDISDHKNIGFVTLKIKGIGQYKGETQLTFKIFLNFEETSLEVANFVFDGQNHNPEVKFNGKLLVLDEDYEIVELNNNKYVGTAMFKIVGKGFYTGDYVATFEITPLKVNENNIANAKVSTQTYTGKEIEPKLDIKVNVAGEEITLTEGEDYTTTFSNNIETGKATITITFIGNYSGTQTVEFEIVPNNTPLVLGVCLGVGGAVLIGAGITIFFLLKRKKKLKKLSEN